MTATTRCRFYDLEDGGELAISYDPATHKRPRDLAVRLARQMGVSLAKGRARMKARADGAQA